MSTEVTMLIWSIVLTLAQMLLAVTGAMIQVGLPKLAGNSDGLTDCEGWVGRAQRAHRNMLENLPLFAVLVLLAQMLGKADDMTAMGAQIFFYARVVYVGVYVAGLPWLRTGVWGASMVGMVMILTRLL
jgi:uncharacterized MAPEG superfamily protein